MIGQAIREGAGSCIVWCVVFFATLPFWGASFVWGLKVVLETLNSVGN
jgi:hypothetical protein